MKHARDLKLEVFELPAHELTAPDDWDAHVQQTGADVYFLTGWQDAWWQSYGAGFAASRRPACFVLRDGARIVAALPFCIETIHAGPLPVRIARLAGIDSNFAIMALPIAPGYEAGVLAAVLEYLTSQMRCAGVSLSPLSDRAPQLTAIRAAASDGGHCILRDRSDRGHTLMPLPDTPDAFMAALSKSRRREVRRDIKRLTEEHPLRNVSSTPETVPEVADAMMDRFIDLHTSQWEAAGKGGHFADWRPAAQFYRALLHRLAPQGAAAIDEQWLGDTLLSSQLRYAIGDKAYWWLNARETAPPLGNAGLGRVGLVERVDDLIRSGTRMIEAGAGEYEYKLSYGGELVPMHSVVLARASLSARMRMKALLLWADALHLGYYRIWFLKLRPRLGTRPRALWTSWIRSRL